MDRVVVWSFAVFAALAVHIAGLVSQPLSVAVGVSLLIVAGAMGAAVALREESVESP